MTGRHPLDFHSTAACHDSCDRPGCRCTCHQPGGSYCPGCGRLR